MSPSGTLRTATAVMLVSALAACQGAPRRKAPVAAATARSAPAYSAPVAPVTTAPVAPTVVQVPTGKPAPRVVARPGAAKAQASAYTLAGFNVYEGEGGRLWVFRSGTEGLASFLTKGEPAKRVTQIGVGPGGRTLMGDDPDALRDYALAFRHAADGYTVIPQDGRLWVFQTGSASHTAFLTKGEPAKRVTLIGAGPEGLTLLGSDTDVMKAYAATVKYAVPGYAVHGAEEGRLWVFRQGSSHHRTFRTKGEPAKRVTLIGQGPEGRTLLGSDTAVLKDFGDSWRFSAPGFVVIADDGRLWVFRQGSEHAETFKTKGEPAKRVTLIGRGPDGRTLLGAEKSTLEDYARAMGAP